MVVPHESTLSPLDHENIVRDRLCKSVAKSGEIPRSRDMVSALGLLFTLLFFAIFMPYLGKTMVLFMKKYLNSAGERAVTPASVSLFGNDFFETYLQLVLPLLVLLMVVAVMVEVVQAKGLRIITQNIRPKWEKFFILGEMTRGLKRIFMSVETFFELLKSIVKVVAIGFIAYYSLRGDMGILRLPEMSLGEILRRMGLVIFKLTFSITLFLLALSALDYLWQRYLLKKSKMSGLDIKDEFKQTEGDPLVKSRQRQVQMRWALQRMMAEVPGADVVITNPTHYAAALKYEDNKMGSPQLVAKGKGLAAERIKQVAQEHHVPIVENPQAAQALYASVEIGAFIPQKLFKSIAEILAYIYKLKGKRMV